MLIKTTGPAWEALLKVANAATTAGANMSNQDEKIDMSIFAMALVAVRTGDDKMRVKCMTALENTIGTEGNSRWLAIARNGGAIVGAADVLGIKDGPIFNWLKSFLTKKQPENNPPNAPQTLQENAWASGSNASSQAGLFHAELSVYTENVEQFEWSYRAFCKFCGDRTIDHKIASNDPDWQQFPDDPVGIQARGTIKHGVDIGGAVGNDMSRSYGIPLASMPYKANSQYARVGLNGFGIAAWVFHHQGKPAFDVVEKAILRNVKFLVGLGPGWYDNDTGKDVKHIINLRYGVSYPLVLPVGANGLVGFSDFWAS